MRGYQERWAPYVPVATRRKNAAKQTEALRKKGHTITPIEIEGRTIARTFWGKAWCTHLESYSDYANRLPRGRTYVRNGSVVHLGIGTGQVDAMVQGSEMYKVRVGVKALAETHWRAIVAECTGKIGSLVELLAGSLSTSVMEIVAHREQGLFPKPREITLACSCPDSASMCKHVAAVLYGVGARLDAEPALLFRLRAVDPTALLAQAATRSLAGTKIAKEKRLDDDALGSVFGIELDDAPPSPTPRTHVAPKAVAPTRAVPVSGKAAATKASRSTATVAAKARVKSAAKPRESVDDRVSLAWWELADAGVTADALTPWIASGLVETKGRRTPLIASSATWRRVFDGERAPPARTAATVARARRRANG